MASTTSSSRTTWIRFFLLICSVTFTLGDEALQLLPAGSYTRTVYVNENYVVTCFAPKNITAVRIAWKGPKKEIKDRQGRIHVEENLYRSGGMDLFFEGIAIRDQGIYECSAVVDGKDVKKAFELKVYKRITFGDVPDVQYITEGSSQDVLCTVSAVPEAKVSWKINGSLPIQDMKHIPRPDQGLTIRNVSREDAGTYTCRATQADDFVSNFEEVNIRVIVKFKPEWRYPVTVNAYSFIGGVVNITCEADGEPTPSYSWMQDDDPVISTQFTRIYELSGKSIMEIHVRNLTDFSEYTCSASNSEGFTQRTIDLLAGEKPAIPKIGVASFDTSTIMLDISDNTDGELQITGYTIEYRTEAESWDDSKKKEVDVADGHSHPEAQYILANLEPSTSYILRVAARNVVGLSDFTDEIVQRTENEPAPRADYTSLSDSVHNSVSTILACLLLFNFLL